MNDPDVLAQRGDYSGYVRQLQEEIDRIKVDELLAEYEKHVGTTSDYSQNFLENTTKNDIIKSFLIGRSVGASAKNYPVKLPDSNQHVGFAEGQVIEGKVFAGKGTSTEIRDRFRLEFTYGVDADEWQKVSGNAELIVDGNKKKAEIHWYSANGQNYEMKVKRYIYED